jgi:hypothetical protein
MTSSFHTDWIQYNFHTDWIQYNFLRLATASGGIQPPDAFASPRNFYLHTKSKSAPYNRPEAQRDSTGMALLFL